MQSHAFSIHFEFLRDVPIPFERFIMKPEDLKDLPPQTKQQGFYFYSPHWIYSKRSLAAPGEPFKRDSLTWIPDDAEFDFESACFRLIGR